MHMFRCETYRGNKQPQDPTMYGQICASVCVMQRQAKRSKSGLSRNQNLTMPGNYVVSTIMGALTVAGNVRGHGPVLLRSQD